LLFILHAKYYSGTDIKDDEIVGRVVHMGHEKKASRVLVTEPEGKRPLGRHM